MTTVRDLNPARPELRVRTIASVIIPTRDRAEMLVGCLQSIGEDLSMVGQLEIIVIDNGSRDRTATVVSDAAAAGPHPIKYLLESEPGISPARNRGIAAATGHFLLHTDDDVLVQPGWAAALVAPFSRADVVAVAGRVLPEWLEPPPAWMRTPHAEMVTMPDLGDTDRDLGANEMPVGANMAIRVAVLRELDRAFDARLGHVAGTSTGFEEYDVIRRLRARGGMVAYSSTAVVRHRVIPSRATWRGMRTISYEKGFGMARELLLRGEAPKAMPRSVASLGLFLLLARARRLANDLRRQRTAAAAEREFWLYGQLGLRLERVFGGRPRLREWLLRHPL